MDATVSSDRESADPVAPYALQPNADMTPPRQAVEGTGSDASDLAGRATVGCRRNAGCVTAITDNLVGCVNIGNRCGALTGRAAPKSTRRKP